MSSKEFTIKIESILGGQAEYRNFAGADQFMESFAIDPDLPTNLPQDNLGGARLSQFKPSGIIRPVSLGGINTSNPNTLGAAMWMIPTPKDENLYVYDSNGSVYTLSGTLSYNGLGDLNDGGTAAGNGAEYNDNYVYFSRATTVARYGPLNGTPAFTDDYWTGTLGKTALTNTTYPFLAQQFARLPNHILHRHSDGRVYLADVVGNQGVLHTISTTKTSVEGDTDNGSTYNKVSFPYGYWPTDIESYGDEIVTALYEGSNSTTVVQRSAKLAFYDGASQNITRIVDFPDPLITALQLDQVSGTLYIFSGQPGQLGTRVSRYIGGTAFEQVAFIDDSEPPFPGAIDNILNRIYFGGTVKSINLSYDGNPTNTNAVDACVWALGSITSQTRKALFNVTGTESFGTPASVTSLKLFIQNGLSHLKPVVAWYGNNIQGIDASEGDGYSDFWSIIRWGFKIGQRFKIKKIRVPVSRIPNDAVVVNVSVFIDQEEDSNYQYNFGESILRIDSALEDGSKKTFTIKPPELIGWNDFIFQIEITGNSTNAQAVKLPITIVGELIDD